MYYFFKFILFLFIFLSLNSCAYFKINELDKKTNNDDTSFYSLLSKEYNDFAKFELYDMHDEIDANYFAYKGLQVLNNKNIYVENPKDWKLSEKDIQIFLEEYTKINLILKKDIYLKYPKEFSLMIAGYDCWIEQSEENWQFKDIEYCKNKYFNNYKKIITYNVQKDSQKEKENIIEDYKTIKSVDNTSSTENISTEMTQPTYNTKVFFAFDSYILDSKQLEKLDNFISLIENKSFDVIYINGHTDRKGSEDYNLKLSIERAKYVKNYLQRNNVKNTMVVKGFGESNSLINTYDNIEEQKNRRTEIIIK